MFADDATITAVADSLTQLHENVSNDFECVIKWEEKNKLVSNVNKIKKIWLYVLQERGSNNLTWYLTYGSFPIKEVTEVKLLGIKIQNNLSWTARITILSKRVMKMTRTVGRIAKFLSKDILKVISHSLIYSHINYCCAVWGRAAQRDMRRLQITLNKAARMVLRCGFENRVSELHIIMGWPAVIEQRPLKNSKV